MLMEAVHRGSVLMVSGGDLVVKLRGADSLLKNIKITNTELEYDLKF